MTLRYSTSTSSNPTNLLALNRTDSSRKILNALNVLVLKPGILANNCELRADSHRICCCDQTLHIQACSRCKSKSMSIMMAEPTQFKHHEISKNILGASKTS